MATTNGGIIGASRHDAGCGCRAPGRIHGISGIHPGHQAERPGLPTRWGEGERPWRIIAATFSMSPTRY
jgi:hypothetical protein